MGTPNHNATKSATSFNISFIILVLSCILYYYFSFSFFLQLLFLLSLCISLLLLYFKLSTDKSEPDLSVAQSGNIIHYYLSYYQL